MRHSIAKLVFLLLLVKIDRLDSRSVEIVYTGQGCDCPKNIPYQVSVPVQPEPEDVNCASYGYKVEVPVQTRAKYSYSFDFVVEEPVPSTPKPACKDNLYATVDKITMPKPDCVYESPVAQPPPPKPAYKPCPYDRTKVCTCGTCKSAKLTDYDYEVVDAPVRSCVCGKCSPSKPQCRYVLSNNQANRIERFGGRSKRDVSSKKQQMSEVLRDYIKSLARKHKKSKLVKRDIKGEYDLLQKDQAALDLTIPDIIQYMPETLMPNFKRGRCNIGCKNCVNKHQEESVKEPTAETADTEKTQDSQTQDSQTPEESDQNIQSAQNESPETSFYQQFHLNPRFTGASYLKRSVSPYQYPYPCYPALMPPPYVPSPLHLATIAQNPGNPIWYQPRPLIDPNGHYVYDRLGHKYEVRNGSLKLVAPSVGDDITVSAPAAVPNSNSEEIPQGPGIMAEANQAQAELNSQTAANQQINQMPLVGAPNPHDQTYDPQMDKVIRDIIYQHPDFIDATEHAPGSLTQPQEVQRDETMQFLGKLIRGRLNNWFGVNDETPSQNLEDLDRYSRETGTSIKFIPVVTVNKDKLTKYRQEQAQATN